MDRLKLAILINAINPKIGGLLIRGPKGSGKTTTVRALIDILPKIKVVKGCPFNCNPEDPSNMCPKCSEKYKKSRDIAIEEREMIVVDLPLGATEDRVIGSLDVEKAIKQGIEALEPGLLASANQNILYVDEINLLPDHIADDLLDAAATGWNVVEREGISIGHPSRFIFIGTMNPEEGELRPQLLDRFPLSVTVERINSVQERMEVVKRNIEFEADPEVFYKKYEPLQEELRQRIVKARELLPKVVMLEKLLEAICNACLSLKVDGLRPDIVISKAACALAAFEDRVSVTLEDVLVAAELALGHRTREGGFLEPATPEEIRKEIMEAAKQAGYVVKAEGVKPGEKRAKGKSLFKLIGDVSKKEEELHRKMSKTPLGKLSRFFYRLNRLFGGVMFGLARKLRKPVEEMPTENSVIKGATIQVGETAEKKELGLTKAKGIPSVSQAAGKPEIKKGIRLFTIWKGAEKPRPPTPSFHLKVKTRHALSSFAGKHAEVFTSIRRGRSFGWKYPQGKPADIHLPATIRAAARKQKQRSEFTLLPVAVNIGLEDIREKLRLYRAPMTIVFTIDLSGSMIFNIDAVRQAILKLHGVAHRYRDRVGIVALKDTGAIVVQHPVTNLRVVANKLMGLSISGYTPLAAGMLKAWEVLKEAKRRDPSTVPVMVIVTDGSANVPLKRSLTTGDVRIIEEPRIIVREYEDLAVEDVLNVCKMIRKEGINTIVINTNPHYYGRETYGFAVTEQIAAITNGRLHVVGKSFYEKEELVEDIMKRIAEDQTRLARA
jgi:Mg-chelatase subunit ChlI/Mg-chelatase subunit ChlD